jgi:hypothetical protein
LGLFLGGVIGGQGMGMITHNNQVQRLKKGGATLPCLFYAYMASFTVNFIFLQETVPPTLLCSDPAYGAAQLSPDELGKFLQVLYEEHEQCFIRKR